MPVIADGGWGWGPFYFLVTKEGNVEMYRKGYKKCKVEIPDDVKIVSVYSGNLIVWALSEEGKVYVWSYAGVESISNVKIVPFHEEIRELFQVYNYAAVITKSGEIYQFKIDYGYIDDTLVSQVHKVVLPEEAGESLFIGGWDTHMTIITSKGKIYQWNRHHPKDVVHLTRGIDDTRIFVNIRQGYQHDVGITSYGEILLLIDNRNPKPIPYDPSRGIPVLIIDRYLLTSMGNVLLLTTFGFTVPIFLDRVIVAMYQMSDSVLFVDQHGSLIDSRNNRYDAESLSKKYKIPPLIPSVLPSSVPWSVPFRFSVSKRVQEQVFTVFSIAYDKNHICCILPKEILYHIFFYL